MNDNVAGFVTVAFCLLMLTITAGVYSWERGYAVATEKFQREAVDQKVAEYNNITGVWQWKQSATENVK